jgi:hypothetical protein
MNRNSIRITIAALLGVAVLIVIALFGRSTAVLWFSFGCCVWALTAFAISMYCWSKGKGTKYILNAVFPGQIMWYLLIVLAVSFVLTIIDQIGIFIPLLLCGLVQLVIFVFFAWRVLALGAAREAIIAVEENVKLRSISWKMMIVDIASIRDRADAACRSAVECACDKIRFADPMEHPMVADITDKICAKIAALGEAVDKKETDSVIETCAVIERLVKERGAKLLVLK